MAKLNTQLESEAAEFFVLAHLLLHKIPSFKNYTRHSGYDIIATNPETNRSARIQVKSRFSLNATGFPISNYNSDFVVFCRLNRSKMNITKHKDPDYYIFPTSMIIENIKTRKTWTKFYLRDVPVQQEYYMNWEIIKTFLNSI